MGAATTALLVYSVQIAVVLGVAALAIALLRPAHPGVRLALWRFAGGLCLLLPLLSAVVPGGAAAPGGPGAAARDGVLASGAVATLAAAVDPIPWLWLGGAVARLSWLGLGALRLRRIRLTSAAADLGPGIEALRAALAPRAALRWSALVEQPVSFGARRPAVFLPPRLAELGPAARQAVVCHELLHVARRDWHSLVFEELVRALLWFHPAVWWLLERIRLCREQLVDQLVVARTGSRRCYMRALVAFADAGSALSPSVAFVGRRHLASRIRQLSEESHMSRARVLSTVAVLAAALSVAALELHSALPLPLPGQTQRATRLEIRLAEAEPAAGLVEATVAGSGKRVYLHAETIATAADVTKARVKEDGSRFSVEVELGAEAAARMAEATRRHVDRPVAILLDGEVVMAPVVRGTVGEKAMITGDFTREEAEQIAAGLAPEPGGSP
jgi:beta-lactamase regulating signal transducer with metallopeptidase domain